MTFHPAYYSVIQYCPDRGRAEAANIGVLLLCPNLGFVGTRLTRSPKRVVKFFGKESFDRARFLVVVHGIEAQVREHYDWSEGVAALERYIGTRANDMQLTPVRTMKTAEPEADLDALFVELVEPAAKPQHYAPQTRAVLPPSFQRLDAGLKAPELRGRIHFDRTVLVPLLGNELAAPYVYANGVTNLVKPVAFSGSSKKAIREAKELGVEGQLIHRHPSPEAGQLIVLPDFSEGANDASSDVRQLLEDFSVRVVEPEQVDRFIAEVAEIAH